MSGPGPAGPTPAGLLAVARAAARAGAAVLSERGPALSPATPEQLGAQTKSSGSDWVTDYDRRAEEAVRAVIAAYRPQDAITGEEFGHTSPERPSGYRWSIDPLDGTTNFLRGIAYHCTSVAVCGPDPADAGSEGAETGSGAGPDGQTSRSAWLAGAVVAPALGRSWYAAAGQGAWTTAEAAPGSLDAELARSAEPVALRGPVPDRSGRLLATGFSYDPARRAAQLAALGELMADFGDVRRLGSAALDLCLVADGTLDAYAEFGTQEHDWAAGALIAQEAGVRVHRPAHPDGAAHPDWMVAGEIDVSRLPDLTTPPTTPPTAPTTTAPDPEEA